MVIYPSVAWLFSNLITLAIFVILPTQGLLSSFQDACYNGTEFSLVYWEQRPYIFKDDKHNEIDGALPEILRSVYKTCCKTNAIISAKLIDYPAASLKETIDDHSNEVIIPVGRRVGLEKSIFLRPFLGLVDSPGVAVVAQKSMPGEDLMAAILDSWPILIFIGMSLSLSGIVMWVLDYRSNTEEFPEFFPSGVFEAVWWAAVTMTTVGYGDKVPRSVGGRLFGVVWINVGLVILAIYMGIVTSSLSSNSLEQVNNIYGIPVAVLNGSAEQQLAILQNAEVHVKRSYKELYKSVESGETRIALVDIFSTPQHSEYYEEYKLYVATVLNEPVIYGAVLPNGTENLRKCFLDYHGNHLLEVHEILEKYINSEQYSDDNSSSGTDYFKGSLFGYTIYGMFGLFMIALVIGLIWQYYSRTQKEHKSQASAEGQQDSNPEHSTTKPYKDKHNQEHDHRSVPLNCSEHTERLMAAQSAELLAMEDEFKAFRKNWEKKFRGLQERHKTEQERLFELDNFGYEM